MEMVLDVDIEKCVGCRICEVACSLKNTGTVNPTRSRIRIIRYEKQGEFHNFVPIVCPQCSTPSVWRLALSTRSAGTSRRAL